MKGYPDDIWTVRMWTVKFLGDIWTVEIWTVKIWTVKTGLGLGLGFLLPRNAAMLARSWEP